MAVQAPDANAKPLLQTAQVEGEFNAHVRQLLTEQDCATQMPPDSAYVGEHCEQLDLENASQTAQLATLHVLGFAQAPLPLGSTTRA